MTPAEFQALREAMGLSRRQLADVLGYQSSPDENYRIVERLETGQRSISPLCARLMTLIHRHWQSAGQVPTFDDGEAAARRDERDYGHG